MTAVPQVFTSGTAVVVCSVGSMTYRGQRRQYQVAGLAGAGTTHLASCLSVVMIKNAVSRVEWHASGWWRDCLSDLRHTHLHEIDVILLSQQWT